MRRAQQSLRFELASTAAAASLHAESLGEAIFCRLAAIVLLVTRARASRAHTHARK